MPDGNLVDEAQVVSPRPDGRQLRRWRYRYLILVVAGLAGAASFIVGQLAFGRHGPEAIVIVGAGYFGLLFFGLMPHLAWRESKRR